MKIPFIEEYCIDTHTQKKAMFCAARICYIQQLKLDFVTNMI